MEDIYSNQKIHYHLKHLLSIKEGKQPFPVRMQLLPENRCNLKCNFCAYRIKNSPNCEGFTEKDSISISILEQTLEDFKALGGKAVEISGGGEPLLYANEVQMFKKIIQLGLQYALITNGILLKKEVCQRIAPGMSWCRISLDASCKKTYAKTKRTSEESFEQAVRGILNVKEYAKNKDFRLGIGFVITAQNYKEIYSFCKMAVELGADLVRIGLIFSPKKKNYYDSLVLDSIKEQLDRSKQDFGNQLKIYDTTQERFGNLLSNRQNYSFCAMKEMGMLVGADSKIYTCCILAYNQLGYIGNLREKRLSEIWNSQEKELLFQNFNPRERCNYPCLYENKNKYINELLFSEVLHKNFL